MFISVSVYLILYPREKDLDWKATFKNPRSQKRHLFESQLPRLVFSDASF